MTPLKDSSIQFDVLKRFPLLVPTNSDFKSYDGFVEAKGILFRVGIQVPNYPFVKDITLNCEWKLAHLLRNQSSVLTNWAEEEMLLSTFLANLQTLMLENLESGDFSDSILPVEAVAVEIEKDYLQCCSAILSELKEIGTNHLVSLSNDFRTLSLNSLDSNGELHVLNFKLPPNHRHSLGTNNFEVTDTDLPDAVIKIIQKEQNVSGAFRAFCQQISILGGIWNSLFLMDQECWVIDPIHPRKADLYRRIFISPPSVMAQVSWDPINPHQPPKIKFQGADSEVDALRCTYEEHLEDWDQNCSIISNLCSVLQLRELPKPPAPDRGALSQTVETGECSICYTVQNEGKLPEESCGKCLISFHTACLFEWLEMMPENRQVHGYISGPCPNCEMVMKCPCPGATI